MNTPTITLNGKEYNPAPPKMKLWREVVKFQQKFANTAPDDETALNEMERLIVAAFNNPAVTVDALENDLDLADFMPLFVSVAEWVAEIVQGKIGQLPNV